LTPSFVDPGIFSEPKIDCHVHVLDPARFPYGANTHYAPAAQEIGTSAQLEQVMNAYGTQHALLVGPNSGYGLDNACMLDAIARSEGRCKGIAVVPNDASFEELRALRLQGVIGIAWNVTHYGVAHYRDAEPLLQNLAALDMFVDIQVEHEQLLPMMPLLVDSGVRVLVDHCGRPTIADGLAQRGTLRFVAVRDDAEVGAKAQEARLVDTELVGCVGSIAEIDVAAQRALRASLNGRDAERAASRERIRGLRAS